MSLPAIATLGTPTVASPAVGAGALSLTAPAITCPLGACANVSWAVNCTVNPGGAPGPFFSRVGATASATIGFGAANAVDLAAGVNYTCRAVQSAADVLGRVASGPAGTFQVRWAGQVDTWTPLPCANEASAAAPGPGSSSTCAASQWG